MKTVSASDLFDGRLPEPLSELMVQGNRRGVMGA